MYQLQPNRDDAEMRRTGTILCSGQLVGLAMTRVVGLIPGGALCMLGTNRPNQILNDRNYYDVLMLIFTNRIFSESSLNLSVLNKYQLDASAYCFILQEKGTVEYMS